MVTSPFSSNSSTTLGTVNHYLILETVHSLSTAPALLATYSQSPFPFPPHILKLSTLHGHGTSSLPYYSYYLVDLIMMKIYLLASNSCYCKNIPHPQWLNTVQI